MATVIIIITEDSTEVIQQKLDQLNTRVKSIAAGFDAKKFTGKVKSFGDALLYQRKLRDEWR